MIEQCLLLAGAIAITFVTATVYTIHETCIVYTVAVYTILYTVYTILYTVAVYTTVYTIYETVAPGITSV